MVLTLTIRPITPEDADRLVSFHERLSPESRRLRFFSQHPHLSAQEVERFVNVDGDDRAALVATVEGEIVGVVRYDRDDGDPTCAEVAVIVRDDMQGTGIGTALLDRIGAHAVARGIRTFTALTLPENQRVRTLFHEFRPGTTSRYGDGVVTVTMPLIEE